MMRLIPVVGTIIRTSYVIGTFIHTFRTVDIKTMKIFAFAVMLEII